jgi:predicted glycogen debranching enzyme
MTDLVRRIAWPGRAAPDGGGVETREWIVTNGLGGYASGTVSTLMTRRYHGLLIAALAAPLGRTYMLSHLAERIWLPDGKVATTAVGWETRGSDKPTEMADLAEFRLELGLPVWRYELGEMVLEKCLFLPYRQNTVHVRYRLVAGPTPVRLEVRPTVHFRPHEQPVSTPLSDPYALTVVSDRYELQGSAEQPRLRFRMHGPDATFRVACETIRHVLYPIERSRGYESTGDLWSPGYFRITFDSDAPATLVASAEPWEAVDALDPETALRIEKARRRRLLAVADRGVRTGPAAELVLAADQFVIAPASRVEGTALIRATGDEARTLIAGYHWFTDWGRDTMISLEGLTLAT